MNKQDYLSVEPSLKEDSWHYRVYCWVRWQKGYGVHPEYVGRCSYALTVLILAPLLWLLKLQWVQRLLLAVAVVVLAVLAVEVLLLIPITAVLLLSAVGTAKAIQILEAPLRWFFTSRKWKIVSPWLVTVVLAATLSTFYVEWWDILWILGKTLLEVVLLSVAAAITCVVGLGLIHVCSSIHQLLKQKFCPIFVVNVYRYYHRSN